MRLAAQHLVYERHGYACAGAADGMTERNRSAVYVEFFAIEMQLAIASQHLRGEGFVQLGQIEIVCRQPRFLVQLLHRGYRTKAHSPRINPGCSSRHNPRQRLQVVLFHKPLAGQDHRGGAVRNA